MAPQAKGELLAGYGLTEPNSGSDAAAIKSASEKLNEAWQAASAELYKAASEKAKTGAAPGAETTGAAGEAQA